MSKPTRRMVYKHWRSKLNLAYNSDASALDVKNYPWRTFAVDPGEVTCWLCGAFADDLVNLLSEEEREKKQPWKAYMTTRSGLYQTRISYEAPEDSPANFAFFCSWCYGEAPLDKTRVEFHQWVIENVDDLIKKRAVELFASKVYGKPTKLFPQFA